MDVAVLFFIVSATILMGSAVLWIKKSLEPPREDGSIAPLSFLMGGVLVSAALLFFPLYCHEYADMQDTVFQSIVSSLHHAAQLFTIDADRDIVRLCYEVPDAGIRNIYAVLLSAEYIIAPVLTAGFIISFFRNTASHIRYALRWFTTAHVFSELNEKSITLAKSIRRDDKRATIVFTDVDEKNREIPFELTKKAKELRAICFRKELSSVRLTGKRPSKKLSLYVIGEDETANINQAVSLAKKNNDMDQCSLYVFTSRDECEYLINQRGDNDRPKQKAAKGIHIRRIHVISSLIYHHLYQHGYENLYKTAKADSGYKTIAVVVAGVGLHGTEMIKALSWYCQMEGYRLRIDAFDKDPLAGKRFAAACPELMSHPNQEHSGDDAVCEIHIHSGIDVATSDFADAVRSLKDTTYVFVSLGADILNINTAIRIRTYFAQAGVTRPEQVSKDSTSECRAVPVIQAVVYNAYEKDKLMKLANQKGERYAINFIGDIASAYDSKVILNSDLEKKAEAIHSLYYSPDTFREYEYNYRSSCAAAIHIRAIAHELSGHTLSGRPIDPERLKWADRFLQHIDSLLSETASDHSSAGLTAWAEEARSGIVEPILDKLKEFTWDSWSSGVLIPENREIIDHWKNIKKHSGEITPGSPDKQNNADQVEEFRYSASYILLVEMLKEQEHRRWNAYMRSEGYIKSENRFDLGKMHPDLRPYSELKPEERKKDIHMDKIIEELEPFIRHDDKKHSLLPEGE